MRKARGVRSEPVHGQHRPGGLVGYRYVVAVAVLVALTTVPMLAAVMAGSAALSQDPLPATADATPFLPYPDPPAGSAGSTAPGNPGGCRTYR